MRVDVSGIPREKWAQGLEWKHLGEFAEVAEQIRQDVKRKLDEFMQTERDRPYTDYQYYHVPENVAPGQQQMPMLLSPLRGQLEHGFAYGNFQIEPDGNIITPNDDIEQRERTAGLNDELYAKAISNRTNIENNLLPVLNATMPDLFKLNIDKKAGASLRNERKDLTLANVYEEKTQQKALTKDKKSKTQRGKALPIESLQKDSRREQIITQPRSVVAFNIAQSAAPVRQRTDSVRRPERTERESAGQQVADSLKIAEKQSSDDSRQIPKTLTAQMAGQAELSQTQARQTQDLAELYDRQQSSMEEDESETVQVRIGGFETIVTGGGKADESIFGPQVFLVRDVQIEDRHFRQGFQLNEKKLIEEVKKSAERFMREGMSFELPQTKNEQTENGDVAYTAILDFGFGDLIVHLKETNPAWFARQITRQISQMRNWYFSIVAIVLLAVTLGLASL